MFLMPALFLRLYSIIAEKKKAQYEARQKELRALALKAHGECRSGDGACVHDEALAKAVW